MGAGVMAGSFVQFGSFIITAAIVSAAVSAAKGRRPVSISTRTTPNAHMSLRRSTRFPAACSGDM